MFQDGGGYRGSRKELEDFIAHTCLREGFAGDVYARHAKGVKETISRLVAEFIFQYGELGPARSTIAHTCKQIKNTSKSSH